MQNNCLKNNKERSIIIRIYNQKYYGDLVAKQHIEFNGEFREATFRSFMIPTEYYAFFFNVDLKWLENKESVLTEISGSKTPQELHPIKQVYADNYDELLENNVRLVILLEIIRNYYSLYYMDKEELVLNLIWLNNKKKLL